MTHAQRQLSLSEADVHHFIRNATYGVNNDNHINWIAATARAIYGDLLSGCRGITCELGAS